MRAPRDRVGCGLRGRRGLAPRGRGGPIAVHVGALNQARAPNPRCRGHSGPGGHRPGEQLTHLRLLQAEVKQHSLARALTANDLLALKGLEVAGGARLGQADHAGKVADAAFPAHQVPDELESGGVPEAGHQAAHAGLGIDHCTQMHNIATD